MPHRLKRASLVRLTVGLAALAFPLLATGAAQAAIAGATPASTPGLPDVRSATLIDPLHTDVCFDKTLANGSGVAADFHLVGYRAGNVSAAATSAPLDPTNNQCVMLTWPASIGDQTQYTAVEVALNAVKANATGAGNLGDAVALTGSTTQAGTRGVTTAPNLVGILAPTDVNLVTNTLTFVFDKQPASAFVAGLLLRSTQRAISALGRLRHSGRP